jgi:hypothetical protein
LLPGFERGGLNGIFESGWRLREHLRILRRWRYLAGAAAPCQESR